MTDPTDPDDLGPIAARTLLASPPFPPPLVGGLTTQQLAHILRGVELAMRLEQLSDDAIERVLHRMVYGSPLGAVAHDVTPEPAPPSPAEERLVDLMADLEASVNEARASRDRDRIRGPRLVPRRDPHLCWRIHPGTEGACQLPNDHDLGEESPTP